MRGFTQDDAHIFCLPEQIAGEIVGVLALVEEVMGAFGFKEFEVRWQGKSFSCLISTCLLMRKLAEVRLVKNDPGLVFQDGAAVAREVRVKFRHVETK